MSVANTWIQLNHAWAAVLTALIRNAQISQKSRSHIRILGARRVMWSKFIVRTHKYHYTKFTQHSDLVPGICAPLALVIGCVNCFKLILCSLYPHAVVLHNVAMEDQGRSDVLVWRVQLFTLLPVVPKKSASVALLLMWNSENKSTWFLLRGI
jgi:hypothetical protein